MDTKELRGKEGYFAVFAAGYYKSNPEATNEAVYAAYQAFLRDNPNHQHKPVTAKEMVNDITNYLNPMGRRDSDFVAAMETEHRTLQQNFTRLTLSWLEHVASEDYQTDGRNEGSQKTAQKLMKGWALLDTNETHGAKPHQWLSFI